MLSRISRPSRQQNPEVNSPPPARTGYALRIREAHQRSGRTLRETAKLCDLDHSYVSLILESKRRPQRDVLISLCTFGWNLDRMETDEILMLANYPPLGRAALREYRQGSLDDEQAISRSLLPTPSAHD